MAPKSPKPDSRSRMVETTIELMRAYGFAGTGINDIVRESEAPKGSVYHFFPEGKVQIACESLAVYSERVERFLDLALASNALPQEKIRILFDRLAERVTQGHYLKSCAVGAVTLDLGEDSEKVRAAATSAFACWIEVIAAHFKLGSPAENRSFASLVMTVIEGAYIRCRAEHTSAAFTEAGRWLAQLAAQPGNGRARRRSAGA